MKYLVVTIPDELSEGLSDLQVEQLQAEIAETVELWREGGPPLVLGSGITLEGMELDDIGPGVYIVGGESRGFSGYGAKS